MRCSLLSSSVSIAQSVTRVYVCLEQRESVVQCVVSAALTGAECLSLESLSLNSMFRLRAKAVALHAIQVIEATHNTHIHCMYYY